MLVLCISLNTKYETQRSAPPPSTSTKPSTQVSWLLKSLAWNGKQEQVSSEKSDAQWIMTTMMTCLQRIVSTRMEATSALLSIGSLVAAADSADAAAAVATVATARAAAVADDACHLYWPGRPLSRGLCWPGSSNAVTLRRSAPTSLAAPTQGPYWPCCPVAWSPPGPYLPGCLVSWPL